MPIEKSSNKSLSPNEHAVKAARIFGLLPVSTINRNKIKIHPISRSTSPSLHNENDIASSSIQKTSIKINTDSSSTVNVNDNVKLYHSSVLINSNSTHQIDNIDEKRHDKQLNSGNKILDQNIEDRPDCHFPKSAKTAITILYSNEQNPVKDQLQGLFTTKKEDKGTLIPINNSTSEYVSSNNNNSSTNERTRSETSRNSSDQNLAQRLFIDSFVLKLLSDPCLSLLLHGLEVKAIASIIENSLARIPINKINLDTKGTENYEIDELLLKQLHHVIKEERCRMDRSIKEQTSIAIASSEKSTYCNLTSPTDVSAKNISNSEIIPIRKICEMLAECSFNKNGGSLVSFQSDHQYESINVNYDPIYEEINEVPPPLPINPPPLKNDSPDKHHKSMFLGATKYDILSYLVDAKDRIDPEEQILSYTYKFLQRSVEETTMGNGTEKNGKIINSSQDKYKTQDKCTAIERNDSVLDQKRVNLLEQNISPEQSKTSFHQYIYVRIAVRI